MLSVFMRHRISRLVLQSILIVLYSSIIELHTIDITYYALKNLEKTSKLLS